MSSDTLMIRGARAHNLKGIDLDLPRDRLIVLTGLSGSGKSSLAFDTIYAEGQRRYVESLSSYARQFLGQMDKPDVDLIEGLSPAISIDQKTASHNPRSTVGTTTEIWDYLRLLWARIGIPHDPDTGEAIHRQTVSGFIDQVDALPVGTKFMIAARVVEGRKGDYHTLLADLAGQGFARARVDEEMVDLTPLVGSGHLAGEGLRLARYETHIIDVIIDRLVAKKGIRTRIAEAIETAVRLTGGTARVELLGNDGDVDQTMEFHEGYQPFEPRDFSFNSPYGACPQCDGLGVRFQVDPDLVIPDDTISIGDGAIAPWAGFRGSYFQLILSAIGTEHGFDIETPWKQLSKKAQKIVLHGVAGKVTVRYKNRRGQARSFQSGYDGIIPWLEKRHTDSESDRSREVAEGYMREVPCQSCEGKRLKPESRAVTIDNLGIADLADLSIGEAIAFFRSLEMTDREHTIADPILKEVLARLQFLFDVGLEYLCLSRRSGTLAGGEAQRIRLASQIGSGLVGVLYVLDEPSIGLHQRDNARLIETLIRLRDLGNTVLVVEHDEETIRIADHIVDIGPGAGEHGGQVVVSGSLEQLLATKDSLTAQYLSGTRSIEVPKRRRPIERGALRLTGASENNLKKLDVDIPLGVFTAITGVSGSGKSTLINDILLVALRQKIYRSKDVPGKYRALTGWEAIDKVIDIDQSPIGRTPRSNPATYTGAFDKIRTLFASTQEAKVRGYKPGRFSFNVKGGRCEHCAGDGTIKIEMHFLPDVYVPCEVCGGARYNRETLDVHFKGKTIAEVLDMSIEEGAHFFENQPSLSRQLHTLVDVGLGYVRLGQSAPTLSGGEAQRVKLASELGKRATGKTLYILDEPTTGLHFEDVRRLLGVLQRLTDTGNTVIVIEHNLDVIKSVDHVIDLGPEGGNGGGHIIAVGTPEAVAANKRSHTGRFLRPMLGMKPSK